MKTLKNTLTHTSNAIFTMLIITLVLIGSNAMAQPYYQLATDLIEEDETRSMQYTPLDGGHVTAGFTYDASGARKMNLVKYDVAGGVLWSFLYDFGTSESWANAVEHTSDGGYILAGATLSPITGVINGALVKVDPAGGLMWSETYDYSSPYAELYSVEELPAVGTPETYVVTGSARNAFNGTLDAISLVVDPMGGIVWNGILDTGFDEEAYSIKPDFGPFGISSYVLTGYTTRGPFAGENILVAKLDASLSTTIWANVAGDMGDERGRSLEVLPSGEIGIAGHSNSYSNGRDDIYLGFFDPTGVKLWSNVYGQKTDERAFSLEIMSDFTFAVTGWTNFKTPGSTDAFILKADIGGGALLVSSAFGGSKDDRGYSVKEAFFGPGDIIMGGYCEGSGVGPDDRNLFGVRTDAGLDSACARKLPFGFRPAPGCVPFTLDLGIFGYSGSVPAFETNPPVEQFSKCCECDDMLIDFTPMTVAACAGDVVTFTNLSECVDAFRWFVNGAVAGPGPDLTYVFPAPGTYVIELAGRNVGCPIVRKSITVVVSCAPTKMSEVVAGASILPNPASDFATINVSELSGRATVDVFNMNGAQVLHTDVVAEGALTHHLDVSALPEGMYTVRIAGKDKVQSIKLLVERN